MEKKKFMCFFGEIFFFFPAVRIKDLDFWSCLTSQLFIDLLAWPSGL